MIVTATQLVHDPKLAAQWQTQKGTAPAPEIFEIPVSANNMQDNQPQGSRKKILSDYTGFTQWKKDNTELFEKYKEAGEKASLPMMVVIRSKAYGQSQPEEAADPTDYRALRIQQYYENHPEVLEAKKEDLNALNELLGLSSKTTPYRLSDDELRIHYGNYFVYNVEKFADDIMRDLKGIQRTQQSVAESELKFETADRGTRGALKQIIDSGTKWIADREANVAKRMDQIVRWAQAGDVLDEAKTFFTEYTKEYYGQEMNLESLQAQYSQVSGFQLPLE